MLDRSVSQANYRLQTQVLIWTVMPVLAIGCLAPILGVAEGPSLALAVRAGLLSLTLGWLVWRLRAATARGALCGGMICLVVTAGTEAGGRLPELHSGLVPLMVLFVLTFVATRLGRGGCPRAQSPEDKAGRSAGQVVANLGAAALVVVVATHPFGFVGAAMLLAALAEATADTVSSEIGQAFGGTPRMITDLREVPPGTDGAITLRGTIAGIAAGSVLVVAGVCAMGCGRRAGIVALLGGVAGLFFDSLLGATVERRGWMGNDLVNFSSTGMAVCVAFLVQACWGSA